MSLPKPPTSVKYFFGRISRDEAENELNMRGCTEGLYLLRESMTTAGNYALSICHQGRYVINHLFYVIFFFIFSETGKDPIPSQ